MRRFSMVTVRKRVAVLLLCFAAVFSVLVLRLGYLELVLGDRLSTWALEQRRGAIPILADRGGILDRNLKELAVSMSTDAVYATPAEIKDPKAVASSLAPILDLDYEWLVDRLSRNQRMVWVKLKVEPEIARRVRQENLPGVGVVVRPQRFYPHDELAANLLGFAGIDNQGLEGIEAKYDNYLKGVDGMLLQERDAAGRIIPGAEEHRIAPQDGNDVILTIDHVIQYIAERELAKAVEETQSEFGMIVLVQPQTGELLASAVYPTFNPNSYGDYSSGLWRNRVVTDQFEPGSTFKVITGSSALDANVTTLNEKFVDPVTLQIGGGRVRCWRAQGHGEETFVEATENSCNPIFAILADRMGPSQFYKYVTAFGFGQRTGIDMLGEAFGMVPKPGKTLHGEVLQWANIGFGQGIAVTPIQLVMAVSAIANGGKLMQPYVVQEVRGPDGELIKKYEPQVVRQPISTETANDFAMVMRSVVVNGSGGRAEAPGYRVAGKTGTAEMPSPTGGYSENRMASFLGFAPVDDPQIAGVVMLVNIGVRPAYGGVWAAPVFGAVINDSLEHMGVPRKTEVAQVSQPKSRVFVPNVQNLPQDEAVKVLSKAGLQVAFDGVGNLVSEQVPRPGAEVKRNSTVRLEFYVDNTEEPDVVVPSVIGQSMRDAAVNLGQAGLVIVVEGSGVAMAQEPPGGTRVPPGGRVVVKFQATQ